MKEVFQTRNKSFKLHESEARVSLETWLAAKNVTLDPIAMSECNQDNFERNSECAKHLSVVMGKVMTLQVLELHEKDLTGLGPFLLGFVDKINGNSFEHLLYGNLWDLRNQN